MVVAYVSQFGLSCLPMQAQQQPDLFDVTRWPRRPYCTDDFEQGLKIRSLKEALTKTYLQANPPHLRVWSIYDIDRPGGGLAWDEANMPPPSWATINKANGHAHLVYGLRAPVLTSSMEARQAPLRYLNAVESAFRAKLGGDDGYSGLITKNPKHPLWWTVRGPELAYELGDLAQWVDLEKFKARHGVKVAEVGLGRNVTVFDFVRTWAYKQVRHFQGQQGGYVHWQKAVYDRCMARNADFGKPMDSREAFHIAKSVAKWTWTRFDVAASDARFSKLQAFRRTGKVAAGTKAIVEAYGNG
jgi:hypothetical protein